MEHKVTIFKDVMSTDTPVHVPIETILNRIENSKYFDLIEKIQSEDDKDKRNELKKKLPAICFSGTFSKRSDKAMIKHSGIICLDFDGFSDIDEAMAFKDEIAKDKYTYATFLSPSGKGIKVLVKIPRDYENHRKYFNALEKYYDVPQFDTSCKNESRVCYEASDPEIYVNVKAKEWTEMADKEAEEFEKKEDTSTLIITDEQKTIDLLMVWWNKSYGFVDGQWNNHLHLLACALCNYGISQDTSFNWIHKIANEQGQMPAQDIKNLVRSAYNRSEFGSKAFEDTRKVNEYAKKIKSGKTKKDIKGELIKDGLSLEEVDKVYDRIEEKAHEKVQVFWSKSDKGTISMNHILFKNYLSDNGFYKYYPEGSENFVMVRRSSNLIHNTMEPQIKDHTLGYLESLQDWSIYNYFAEKTKYFKYDFLGLMESITIEPPQDTLDTAHLFFRNCVVIVKKRSVKTIPYDEFDHWVWADHVIKRDFQESDTDGDFATFVSDLGSDEDDRIKSIQSTIGYLLHSYKDPGYSPAVILNDEVISDNPEGGTGKGLFVNAVAQLKKTALLDGKAWDPKKSFPYQTVKTDTQILSFDDVKYNFDFERLFSVITEGITLEYKNKTAIKIPKERSPKIVVTTNYAIAGEGHSHERRKWELEFSQFYNKEMTPTHRLGKRLFDEWDDDEWRKFDNYMIKCLQLFLNKGLIKSKFKNLKQRKFHSETSKDFADWAEDKDNVFTRPEAKSYLNEMFGDFTTNNPDYQRMKRNTFYRWIEKYGEYKFGRRPEKRRDGPGTYVVFKVKDLKSNQLKAKL